MPFTVHEIQEYAKCAEDPIYFIKHYVKIVNVDEGLVPFHMYPYQENMVRTFHENRFVIAKCPRQVGKSTTVVGFLLHQLLFNENNSIAILANKERTARELLGRLKLAYEWLPKWLQQGIVTWNKGDLELENGSKILAASTSSSAVRGGSFNIIFLDEFAFVPNNMSEQFFSSVYPTISSGKTTKVIIVSTPNGMNLFYKMWVEAEEKRSSYVTFSVHWSEVPGRDEKWKKETIANTSEEQFSQEFDCDFLGSANTLIAAVKLKAMTWRKPVYSKDSLDIHFPPQKDRNYVLIADVAKGKEQDFSTFSVIDITEVPYRVVAKYRSSVISTLIFPDIIYTIATKYNNAFVLIEINDLGTQVAQTLQSDLEYDNIITTTMKSGVGQQVGGGFGKSVQFGVLTDKSVKRIGCNNLKTMIEADKLIAEDFEIVEELSQFVRNKRASYSASEGNHDDLVMTLVLFAWLVNQKYFKDMTDQDIHARLVAEREAAMEADTWNLMFLDNGIDSEDVSRDRDGQLWHSVSPTR